MEETNGEEVITNGSESDIRCVLVTGVERDLICLWRDSFSTLAYEKKTTRIAAHCTVYLYY